jgi:hypothetical protein
MRDLLSATLDCVAYCCAKLVLSLDLFSNRIYRIKIKKSLLKHVRCCLLGSVYYQHSYEISN